MSKKDKYTNTTNKKSKRILMYSGLIGSISVAAAIPAVIILNKNSNDITSSNEEINQQLPLEINNQELPKDTSATNAHVEEIIQDSLQETNNEDQLEDINNQISEVEKNSQEQQGDTSVEQPIESSDQQENIEDEIRATLDSYLSTVPNNIFITAPTPSQGLDASPQVALNNGHVGLGLDPISTQIYNQLPDSSNLGQHNFAWIHPRIEPDATTVDIQLYVWQVIQDELTSEQHYVYSNPYTITLNLTPSGLTPSPATAEEIYRGLFGRTTTQTYTWNGRRSFEAGHTWVLNEIPELLDSFKHAIGLSYNKPFYMSGYMHNYEYSFIIGSPLTPITTSLTDVTFRIRPIVNGFPTNDGMFEQVMTINFVRR